MFAVGVVESAEHKRIGVVQVLEAVFAQPVIPTAVTFDRYGPSHAFL